MTPVIRSSNANFRVTPLDDRGKPAGPAPSFSGKFFLGRTATANPDDPPLHALYDRDTGLTRVLDERPESYAANETYIYMPHHTTEEKP